MILTELQNCRKEMTQKCKPNTCTTYWSVTIYWYFSVNRKKREDFSGIYSITCLCEKAIKITKATNEYDTGKHKNIRK